MQAAPALPAQTPTIELASVRAERLRRAARALKPDPLLLALAVMNLCFVWRVQDVFPILSKTKVAFLAQLTAVILFSIDHHPRRKIAEVLNQPILRMITGLLLLMILGLPFSLWRGKTFEFLTTDFMPTFAMMFMMATAIRGFKDVEFFAWVNLLGCGLYTGMVGAFAKVRSGGRLGDLAYYDANDLALLSVAMLPIAVYFVRPKATSTQRMVGLVCLGFNLFSFLKAGSRGGFLGIIVVGLYILLQYRAVPTRLRLGAVIAGVTIVVTQGSDKFWANMKTLLNPKEDYNYVGKDNDGRMEIWKRGIGYMMTHPLLGVGARAFPQAEGMLSEFGRANTQLGAKGWKWSAAHNSFVEVGAETGILGLGLFCGSLFVAIRSMSRLRREYPKSRRFHMRDVALGQALLGAIVGYSICAFFITQAYMAFLYMLFGMVIGLNRVSRSPSDEEEDKKAPARTARRRFSGMPAQVPALHGHGAS